MDIVFITDGEAGITDEFLNKFKKFKDRKEVMVRAVIIDVGSSASRGSVKEFADSIATLSDIADLDKKGDEVAAALFGDIQK